MCYEPASHLPTSYACTLLSMFLKIVNLFLIEDELTVFNILEFLCFPKRSWWQSQFSSVQFSSVAQSCLTPCDAMKHSTPGLPVHHQLPEFTQTHVHRVGDAIQPLHPLLSPSPPALNLSQHQGLFKWVSSSHQGTKVLEFQLQHESFQCIFRTDFL